MQQTLPRRIALISEYASPLAALGGTDAGGQNVYVEQVAKCMARAGHRVDVLKRRDSKHLAAAVDVCRGMRTLHINAGPVEPVRKEALLNHMPAFGDAARQLMRRSMPYDVVHANFFMCGFMGMTLRNHLQAPLVVTLHALGLVRREHQGEQDTFPNARIDIEHRLVQTAQRVVAECPQDKADLMRLYGASPSRIATAPCGVDLTQFAPGSRALARRESGLADDEFVVLQLSRIVPRKGIDNVIRAVAAMHHRAAPALRSGKRVRLLVVGGQSEQPDELATPEIGELDRLAQSLGIADRVTFAGQRQRHALRSFYVASDVFVSTPWCEPFGITPIEAVACARPVAVCSAVGIAEGSAEGGIKFSVADGVTGFHVPPRDPQALAQRLRELRDNPALADAMGRAGARRVHKRSTWEQVSQSLVEVYGAARFELARIPTHSPTHSPTRTPMHAPVRPIEAGRLLAVRKPALHHVGTPVRTRAAASEISAR